MKRMATPNGYYKRLWLHYLKNTATFLAMVLIVLLIGSVDSIVDLILSYFGL